MSKDKNSNEEKEQKEQAEIVSEEIQEQEKELVTEKQVFSDEQRLQIINLTSRKFTMQEAIKIVLKVN